MELGRWLLQQMCGAILNSNRESDEEEVAETVGMETGRLSSLDSLELVLKAIQNVKEEQMVKTSCRGKVVVDLLSMLPQNGKNITDLCASLVKELETCFHDSSKFMGGQTSIVVGKLWSSYHKAPSPRRSGLYGSHL